MRTPRYSVLTMDLRASSHLGLLLAPVERDASTDLRRCGDTAAAALTVRPSLYRVRRSKTGEDL
jgi:hypothetical protein